MKNTIIKNYLNKTSLHTFKIKIDEDLYKIRKVLKVNHNDTTKYYLIDLKCTGKNVNLEQIYDISKLTKIKRSTIGQIKNFTDTTVYTELFYMYGTPQKYKAIKNSLKVNYNNSNISVGKCFMDIKAIIENNPGDFNNTVDKKWSWTYKFEVKDIILKKYFEDKQ